MNKDDLIIIGVVSGKHGIKGLLKVKWFTERAEGLEKYNPIFLDDGTKYILKIRFKNKDQAICYFEGVNNSEKADLLKGKQIYAKRSVFPELKNDEYYQSDLIGCRVEDNKGKFLGNVSAVFDYGSSPLLEIGKELVVFNNDNFPLVKIKEKKIISKYDFFGDIQND
ncbi:MAG: Ribosome maturation factor RimM [Alphaproteobacteria bacterium MarineAlpha9_Bin3]|nr:MAG: Ribosome maturation factor RimM [Alphaproteobacteria bacterium MarineAlpha9_Bin3]|tara:strand:+ start:69 stop:569 length:501 start_codon:yes stop_codon:yes gene_type:complete